MSAKESRDEAKTKSRVPSRRNILLAGTSLAAASALGSAAPIQTAQAQLPTKSPPGGSPSINAIDRTQLPLPESKFQGVIGKSYIDSKPDWPKVPTPPEGAPNVVVILLDDVGFGQVSTFGGPVPTPELDKLAAQGLR